MYMYAFLFFLLMTSFFSAQSQDLSQYRWEHRLVLILAESPQSAFLQEQLDTLLADRAGLDERKLIIIQATPDQVRMGMAGVWTAGSGIYKSYGSETEKEEVMLMGLDGGVKLRKQAMLSLEELFDTIDSMPMRQAEMRNQDR